MTSVHSQQMQVDQQVSASASEKARGDRLMEMFSSFRQEIDQSHDRRERIVKISRDITAESKKIIFALHRITTRDREQVFKEVEERMKKLRELFERVEPEVKADDFWRYERSISPGIQEYLEALTFYYYLRTHSIATLSYCQSYLPASTSAPNSQLEDQDPTSSALPAASLVHITVDDYLGGIADLTGELMRLAIASVGKNLNAVSSHAKEGEGEDGGGMEVESIELIGRLVRELKGEIEPLAHHARWLPKKICVLNQSLSKIESALYTFQVRGAEFKDSPQMLAMLAQKLAAGGGGGVGVGGGREREDDGDDR